MTAAAVSDRPAAEQIRQAGEARNRRIESLRAVAALGVFVGHTFIIALAYRDTSGGLKNQLISGGLLTVFLFFTLSGYLLFWPFVQRDYGDRRTLSLATYARNRALRILPLYYVAVVVLLWLEPLGAERSDWWRYALFIQDYSIRTVERLDSPMWSLAVELQFYILLPLLAAVIARLSRRSLRGAIAIVAALGAASLGLRLADVTLAASTNFSPLNGPFALPTLFYFFTTGMLVALLRLELPRWAFHRACGWLASPDPWILLALPLWGLAAVHPHLEALIAAASFLIVGGCVLAPGRGVLVRVLDWRPLAAVGVASYSLYLWHVPLLVKLSGTKLIFFRYRQAIDLTAPQSFKALLALGLVVCVGVAFISYVAIESPFLRLRRRWS
jgi:peptidoglycan/LPS O-acetylase OafA/YrhL